MLFNSNSNYICNNLSSTLLKQLITTHTKSSFQSISNSLNNKKILFISKNLLKKLVFFFSLQELKELNYTDKIMLITKPHMDKFITDYKNHLREVRKKSDVSSEKINDNSILGNLINSNCNNNSKDGEYKGSGYNCISFNEDCYDLTFVVNNDIEDLNSVVFLYEELKTINDGLISNEKRESKGITGAKGVKGIVKFNFYLLFTPKINICSAYFLKEYLNKGDKNDKKGKNDYINSDNKDNIKISNKYHDNNDNLYKKSISEFDNKEISDLKDIDDNSKKTNTLFFKQYFNFNLDIIPYSDDLYILEETDTTYFRYLETINRIKEENNNNINNNVKVNLLNLDRWAFSYINSIFQPLVSKIIKITGGRFRIKFIKGENSKLLKQLLDSEEDYYDTQVSEFTNKEEFSVKNTNSVFIFDRSVDLITPFLSQGTYKGALDEFFGIGLNNIIEFDVDNTDNNGNKEINNDRKSKIRKLIRNRIDLSKDSSKSNNDDNNKKRNDNNDNNNIFSVIKNLSVSDAIDYLNKKYNKVKEIIIDNNKDKNKDSSKDNNINDDKINNKDFESLYSNYNSYKNYLNKNEILRSHVLLAYSLTTKINKKIDLLKLENEIITKLNEKKDQKEIINYIINEIEAMIEKSYSGNIEINKEDVLRIIILVVLVCGFNEQITRHFLEYCYYSKYITTLLDSDNYTDGSNSAFVNNVNNDNFKYLNVFFNKTNSITSKDIDSKIDKMIKYFKVINVLTDFDLSRLNNTSITPNKDGDKKKVTRYINNSNESNAITISNTVFKKFDFGFLSKKHKLFTDDADIKTDSVFYAYNGYVPLLVKLVKEGIKYGWQNSKLVQDLPGYTFASMNEKQIKNSNGFVVIIVIGGVTYSEITAFQALQKKDYMRNKKLIIITTGKVNYKNFV